VKVVVTGGGGFLGSALATRLLARGDEVLIVGRGSYPAMAARGARVVSWDLAVARPGLERIFEGADLVFHTAARAGVWGKRADYLAINVLGTERVLAACLGVGVPKLVFTGSPSCTFDGKDAENATEADCPYPSHFEAFYPESKAMAERIVLSANSPALATTSLRPHLIYGPEDPHLLPRLIARARAGRLLIVGDGKNRVGLTYVENAASAHLSAGDVLAPGSPNAGKAYFVTDAEPVVLWDWISRLLVAVGERPPTRRIPLGLARGVGAVLEALWTLFGREDEPPATRFVASQLATSHYYDLRAARTDFGYAPPVDAETAFEATVAMFRNNAVKNHASGAADA